MTEFEIIEKKLDHAIALLERLCAVVDPNPGYYQASDGTWRNRRTGENQWQELQRRELQRRESLR